MLHRAGGVFQAFIESRYRGDLKEIFFSEMRLPRIKRFITSILGGHMLRTDNPLVTDPQNALQELAQAAVPNSARS